MYPPNTRVRATSPTFMSDVFSGPAPKAPDPQGRAKGPFFLKRKGTPEEFWKEKKRYIEPRIETLVTGLEPTT
jgi:hypothetical protein